MINTGKIYEQGRWQLRVTVLLAAMLFCFAAEAQPEVGAAIKVRVAKFYGTFGQTYGAMGYEPSVTLKPSSKPWAGGLSYSQNILTYDATSDLKAVMNLITVHAGAKKAIGRHVHPFAYLLAGLRFTDYKDEAAMSSSENDPVFTSFSLSYGARTGLQVGGGNWRFEGSIEYTTGTKARYLTPASFQEAAASGNDYRAYTSRSPISGVSVGAGVVYVFGLGSSE